MDGRKNQHSVNSEGWGTGGGLHAYKTNGSNKHGPWGGALLAGVLMLGFSGYAWGEGMVAVSVEAPAQTQPAEVKMPVAATQAASAAAATSQPTEAKVDGAVAGATSRPSIENTAIRSRETGQHQAGNTKGSTGVGTSMMDSFYSVLQVIVALGVVIGLILIGKTLARKWVPGAAAGTGKGLIEVLARYPLAKGQALVMVRIGSQVVVLSQNKETSQSIMVINEPTEVANILGQVQGTKNTSIQAGFTKLLANAQMDLEKGEGAEEFTNRRLSGKTEDESDESEENLDAELDEMAVAKRQLLELRAQVRSVRENLSRE